MSNFLILFLNLAKLEVSRRSLFSLDHKYGDLSIWSNVFHSEWCWNVVWQSHYFGVNAPNPYEWTLLGTSPYLTLYISTTMSWRRLLYKKWFSMHVLVIVPPFFYQTTLKNEILSSNIWIGQNKSFIQQQFSFTWY